MAAKFLFSMAKNFRPQQEKKKRTEAAARTLEADVLPDYGVGNGYYKTFCQFAKEHAPLRSMLKANCAKRAPLRSTDSGKSKK